MATLYSIKDWDKHFEISQSKRKPGTRHGWVAIPNRHDGKNYRRLMRRPDGPQLYGAWCLITQVASKCPVRGVLKDEDGPLTAEDLELKTDCPAEIFEKALQVLSSTEVGWLIKEEFRVESDDGTKAFGASAEPVRSQVAYQPTNQPIPTNQPSATEIASQSDHDPTTNWLVVAVELKKAGIKAESAINETIAKARSRNDEPRIFLDRLAVGMRTIEIPENRRHFKSPAGALKFWLDTDGEWPTDEIIKSPEEVKRSAQVKRDHETVAEADRKFTAIIKRWKSKGDSEVAKQAMKVGFTKEFCEVHGFSPADADESQ